MNPYKPKFVKIMKIEEMTSDIRLFRVDFKCRHRPGQFVEIFLPHYGEAPMSICSCSTQHLEMAIRAVGNVSNAVHKLNVGDTIGIRGPYGNGYDMKSLKGKHLYIIGGGTGVAPLRGIIKYAEQHPKDFASVNIFMGFRNPEQVFFKEDIELWQRMFNVYLTVDQPSKAWRHCCGVITTLLEIQKLINENGVAMTCGPPVMIKFVIKSLNAAGFRNDQIFMSLERLMRCGIGKCGHCMVSNLYVCKDGPVFRYDQVQDKKE